MKHQVTDLMRYAEELPLDRYPCSEFTTIAGPPSFSATDRPNVFLKPNPRILSLMPAFSIS